jgi:hypothetical protein
MSVPKAIFDYLRAGDVGAVCDDCIQATLNLRHRQQVQQVTATLALTKEFDRRKDWCFICNCEKQTISAKLSYRPMKKRAQGRTR